MAIQPTQMSGLHYSKRLPSSLSALIIVLISIILVIPSAFAKPEPGIDFILAIDNSGSMRKNDPLKMRIQAAKMFITLLSENDRVSLVRFSDRAYKMTGLLSLANYKNELKIYDQLDRLSAKGLRTNIYAALRHSYERLKLKNSVNREKIIILMSDGKMDLGNNNLDLRLLERTLEDLTPKLAQEKIRVYSIAFTETSYIPLLRLAAHDTDGTFTLVKNANAVHQVFENIFERSKSPNMLPIIENSFIVDKNVNELTIVASKLHANTSIALENPSGQDFNKKMRQKNIRWFNARKFDLITINKPETGFWRLKFSEGENKAYIVADLKLNSIISKTTAEPGKPFLIQAWLQKGNKKLTNKAILNNAQFILRITKPDEMEEDFPLVDDGSEVGSERKDGIYGNTLTFYAEGIYKLEVIITGETFDRKKVSFIDIKSLNGINPFAPLAKDLPPTVSTLKEAGPVEEILAETLEEAEVIEEPVSIPLATDEAHVQPSTTEEPDDSATSDTHISAADNAHPEAQISTEETEEKVAETNYSQMVIGFILLNLALGLGYAAYYYYRQRFKKFLPARESTSENEEVPKAEGDDADSNNAQVEEQMEELAESKVPT